MSGGSVPPQDSLFENESENLVQLDGNISISSDSVPNSPGFPTTKNKKGGHPDKKPRHDKISTAINLPIIATYNVRSLIPKIQSLKNDILERSVSLAFLQEIWEQSDDKNHQFEIEKLLELDGLQYISNPRPKNSKGNSL